MFFDPMPTPAGRAGRYATVVGLVGWLFTVAGAAFYFAAQGHDDVRIAGGLDRVGRVLIGVAVVCYLIGVCLIASGFVQKMNGIPDPGMKTLIVALVVNGAPMVGVAGYVVGGMVLAKLDK